MEEGNSSRVEADVGEIAIFSVKAVANILLQYSLPIVLAYKGFITNLDVGGFSRAMNYILVPYLSFASIGSRLSQEIFLKEGWILAVVGMLACYEFFTIAYILRPLAKPTEEFARLYVVIMSLPNVVALPVEITQTFCRLGIFEEEYSTVEECNSQALLYIFMYIVFNNFNIWIVFYNYLRNGNRLFEERNNRRTEDTTTAGSTAGVEDPKSMEQDAEIRLAKQNTGGSKLELTLRYISRPFKYVFCQIVTRPPVLGSIFGLFVGLVPQLQYLIFGQDSPLEVVGFAVTSMSQATVPIINLVMAFSIGLKLREITSWKGLLGSKEIGAEPRTVIASALIKGFLLPGIHFAIIYAILPIMPENRLFRLVLFVSSVCPTASIVVVVAHVAGLGELANTGAFIIIPQYVVAIPGLIVFLTAALYIIG